MNDGKDLENRDAAPEELGVAAVKEHYGQKWIELEALPKCAGEQCQFIATGGCRLPDPQKYEGLPCEQLRIFMEAVREALYDEFNILNNVDRMIVGIVCMPSIQMLAQMRMEAQSQPMQGFSKKSGMLTPYKINQQYMNISKELRTTIYQLDYKKRGILQSRKNLNAARRGMVGRFREDNNSLV